MTTSVGVRWSAKQAKTKAEINKEDDDGWKAFEEESRLVWRKYIKNDTIPWLQQTEEIRKIVTEEFEERITENPRIHESLREKLKTLYDWRLAQVGQQEKKKARKRKSCSDRTENTDQADDPEQKQNETDREIVVTYLEKLEAVRLAREALPHQRKTVFDNQMEQTSTLFSMIRDRTLGPGGIPRVNRFQAESLLASDNGPSVFVLLDRESHSRRRYKSTEDVIAALKVRYDALLVMDSGLDSEADNSFSGQVLNFASVEERLLHRTSASTIAGCSRDEALALQPPINCLDLQCLEYNVKPYPLTQERYTLLDLLAHFAQTVDSANVRDAGKTNKVRYSYEDLGGCERFTIIGQEDAISLTHHDHHGVGTFIEVIDGLKLGVFWPDMSEEDWEEFKDEGMYWMKGRPKWTLLRPGEVLFMGAGRCVPHLIVTLKTSTCIGGFFWDSQRMESTLEGIYQELQQDDLKTTNEGQAIQLDPVLKTYRWFLQQPEYKRSAFYPSNPETIQKLLNQIFQELKRKKAKPRREPEQTATNDGSSGI